jgi:pimeloyl-ACP methyl ester carboxylesterase
MSITHRFTEVNGIKIHIAEAGVGPLVVLCHGFPESWYSWRHQIKALSEAGYHVVAPDMRGYGQTDRPNAIDQYSLLHLVGDIVGLVNAIGDKQAVVIGHDWGAPVAWHCALFRPDLFRAVAGLSVPYRPRGPAVPTTLMPQTDSEIFYQLYFQTEGVAEKEFEQDIARTIRLVLAGRADKNAPARSPMVPRQGAGLLRRRCHRRFQIGSQRRTSTFTSPNFNDPGFEADLTGIEISTATGSCWHLGPAPRSRCLRSTSLESKI